MEVDHFVLWIRRRVVDAVLALFRRQVAVLAEQLLRHRPGDRLEDIDAGLEAAEQQGAAFQQLFVQVLGVVPSPRHQVNVSTAGSITSGKVSSGESVRVLVRVSSDKSTAWGRALQPLTGPGHPARLELFHCLALLTEVVGRHIDNQVDAARRRVPRSSALQAQAPPAPAPRGRVRGSAAGGSGQKRRAPRAHSPAPAAGPWETISLARSRRCDAMSARLASGPSIASVWRSRAGPAALRQRLVLRERRRQHADHEGFQRVGQEPLPACVALNLAARRLRNVPGLDQDNRVRGELVIPRHGLSNGAHDTAKVRFSERAPDLLHHDQPFVAVDLDRERGHAPGTQDRMAGFHGFLDILRKVVSPADDDQVLDAAADEKLAVVKETQIPGPQKRTVAASARCARKVAAVLSSRSQ